MRKQSSSLLIVTRNFTFTILVGLSVVLLVAVLGVRAWVNKRTAVFTTTTSPQNTYSVNLKGAKGRPLLIPYWVSADVYKMGEPYVADVLLHEAWDAFDLSFELGFPEIRWPANNVVEFYRSENFEHGNDVLIVQNQSGKPVGSLFVDVVSKFLVIDLRPGSSVTLKVPKSKINWQSVSFEGVLADDTEIPHQYEDFNRRARRGVDATIVLSILESGSTIEIRPLPKN